MGSLSESCQYIYRSLRKATLPDPRWGIPIRRIWWTLKKHVWYAGILGPSKYASKVFPTTRVGRALPVGRGNRAAKKMERIEVEPGDWVEIRSVREIFATLDAKGQHRGLPFTKEMVKFCGRRFKVYKRLDRIVLEATGELRKMKNPTLLLEGVFCDGEFHGNCDRSCFCYWRDGWLRPVGPSENREGE